MKLERRVSQLEQATAMESNNCFTCVWQDDQGALRDREGSILTEKPSGIVIIMRKDVDP